MYLCIICSRAPYLLYILHPEFDKVSSPWLEMCLTNLVTNTSMRLMSLEMAPHLDPAGYVTAGAVWVSSCGISSVKISVIGG